MMPWAPDPLWGNPVGPWRPFIAVVPRRMFDGHWVWLRRAWRRRIQGKMFLTPPPGDWWQYTDQTRGSE
jgi:hypothetical protein